MIDPKVFIKGSGGKSNKLKDIQGTFNCSEPGCFESVGEGKYDSDNKKVYWVCPNGHEGSARLSYE